MRSQLRILPLLAVAACLAGCYSTDNVDIRQIKTDAIYQLYRVTYIAADDEARIYARFRVGGSTGTNLELTGESAILCNGQPLRESSLFGRCYVGTMPGYVADYGFVFTDAEGRELNNSLKLPRADFADDTPETLSRGERHRLRFVGPPLGAGEAITLEAAADLAEVAKLRRDDPFGAEKKLRDSNKTLGRSREVGATSIDLDPQVLASMSDGPVTIQWSRAVERKLQDATPEGGILRGQYLSVPRTITLTE